MFPSPAAWSLLLPYLVMVALNVGASAAFQRAATDGFAYSYLQPDGPTFGVWGLIYTWLLVLCVRAEDVYVDARSHLQYAFLLNGLWLVANGLAVKSHVSYWLAVAVLAAYWAMLATAYRLAAVDYLSRTPVWVHGALSANLGWVTLAALLNATNTAFNDKLDLSKRENLCAVGGPDWAIGVLGLAAIVGTYLALERGDFVFGAILVHALLGVARNQTPGSDFPHKPAENLRTFAQVAAGVMAVVVLLTAGRVAWRRVFAASSLPTAVSVSSSSSSSVMMDEKLLVDGA